MELALVILVGLIFLGAGLVCVGVVMIGLPGTWMMLALAVLIEVADALYLPAERATTFGWWLLGICAVLAALGEVLEFIAGALGAKKAGSSRRGMVGALIGGAVGAVLGIGVPPPPFGSIVCATLGTFVGAIIGELQDERVGVRESLRPAAGATVGKILGTLSKLPIAMLVWAVLTVAALWP